MAAKGVLKYLAGSVSCGINFGGGDTTITGYCSYCNANYVGDLDTRRSTTGYVFVLNGGAISWSSRLQPTVAASTMEAEYMAAAAAAAVKEALWLRKLSTDMGLPVTTTTFVHVSTDSNVADSHALVTAARVGVLAYRERTRSRRIGISIITVRTTDACVTACLLACSFCGTRTCGSC